MEDAPAHRYTATLANEIERRWQDRWAADGTYHAPNPAGDLSEGWDRVAGREKLFVLDMFPYPSGTGLHVEHRLAYIAEAPVNWCPALGTVLANEEVTADGRSERGNFPVYRRPLKQWMLRITAYAERLIEDLDLVDWPEPVKLMQRNWIGRSEGARVTFPLVGADDTIEVFTTRPDTLFGATFMVLAPEHPLVDVITAPDQRDV